MPLEAPQQQGDMLNQADCLNHTMVVAPTEFIPHIQTVNTKPGEQSPAIRVNVADFADPDNPVIYRGVLWFGVISGNLKRQIGSFIAARMSQGAATPGRNAPWQLADITNEADWMAHLGNWLDNTQAGIDFQAEAIAEVNRAASAAQVAGVAQAPAANTNPAPAPAAPAAAPRPTTPAPRPAGPAGPAAPVAASPVSAPAASAGLGQQSDPRFVGIAPGLAQMIAALPADQQDAAIAVARAQSGASS
jgi:hypothetical protein